MATKQPQPQHHDHDDHSHEHSDHDAHAHPGTTSEHETPATPMAPSAATRHSRAEHALASAQRGLGDLGELLVEIATERQQTAQAEDDARHAVRQAEGLAARAADAAAAADAARLLSDGTPEEASAIAAHDQAQASYETALASVQAAKHALVETQADAARQAVALAAREEELKGKHHAQQRLVDQLERAVAEAHATLGSETLADLRRRHGELLETKVQAEAVLAAASAAEASLYAEAADVLAAWPALRDAALDLAQPPAPDAGQAIYASALAFLDAVIAHGSRLPNEWHGGVGPMQRLQVLDEQELRMALNGALPPTVIAQKRKSLADALGWAADRAAHQQQQRRALAAQVAPGDPA